jgi:ATP-binding cassette, subfamily C, bacterial CydC
MSELLQILALWRRRAAWLLLGLVISLVALAAGLLLLQTAGARLAAGAATVVAAGGVLRVLGGTRVVGRYLERLVTHAATFRALADLRIWFFHHLAARSAGGLGYARAGDVLARLVGDVEALDGLYLRILLPAVGALLAIPLLVFAIPHAAGWLVVLLVLLLALAAAYGLPLLAMRASRDGGTALAEANAGLRIAAVDAVTALREIRVYQAEDRIAARLAERQSDLNAAQGAIAHQAARAGAAAFLCGQAAILALLVLAVPAAPVAAVGALFLAVAVFEALGGLPRAGVAAGHAAAAARRVLAAADAQPACPDPARPAASPGGHALRFEELSFTWAADRPPVFDNLTMEIPAGSRIALLGPSGAGKSTLAALALKLAAPQSGRILLGGTDIASLPADTVRQRIAYLSQATHLFDDTIAANLRLANPDADDNALWAALEAAAVAPFVRGLPDGLDTWLGEGGARVSGGQGRRLALARTLLATSPILLLDEPAAGLDADTERAFLATLNDVAAGRTVIMIAHRLVGIERLDRIYRLSGGHAVAAAA